MSKIFNRFYRLFLLSLLGFLISTTHSYGHIHDTNRPDAHAPLSVMGDHTHSKGEWMMSYRYMTMSMNELNTTFSGTGMEPLNMRMKMHMVSIMFAPSDVITLSVMAPYLRQSMTMKKSGIMMKMSSKTDGLGDPSVMALTKLFSQDGRQFHLNTGFSVPLGGINQKNSSGDYFSYGMQLGSGTVDITLGGTYLQQLETWSYGAQLLTLTRLGTNSRDYRLGDRWQTSAWIATPIRSNVSVSSRLTALKWGDIEGQVSDDDRYVGGHSIELGIGLNYLNNGLLSGHRLATEIVIPVYHALNGVQLKTDWTLIMGWQKAF
jgi:hypothetical protein